MSRRYLLLAWVNSSSGRLKKNNSSSTKNSHNSAKHYYKQDSPTNRSGSARSTFSTRHLPINWMLWKRRKKSNKSSLSAMLTTPKWSTQFPFSTTNISNAELSNKVWWNSCTTLLSMKRKIRKFSLAGTLSLKEIFVSELAHSPSTTQSSYSSKCPILPLYILEKRIETLRHGSNPRSTSWYGTAFTSNSQKSFWRGSRTQVVSGNLSQQLARTRRTPHRLLKKNSACRLLKRSELVKMVKNEINLFRKWAIIINKVNFDIMT